MQLKYTLKHIIICCMLIMRLVSACGTAEKTELRRNVDTAFSIIDQEWAGESMGILRYWEYETSTEIILAKETEIGSIAIYEQTALIRIDNFSGRILSYRYIDTETPEWLSRDDFAKEDADKWTMDSGQNPDDNWKEWVIQVYMYLARAEQPPSFVDLFYSADGEFLMAYIYSPDLDFQGSMIIQLPKTECKSPLLVAYTSKPVLDAD